MAVKVLTDSTNYIPDALRAQYDIRRVSLQLAWGSESYREVDLDNDHFYPLMEARGIPTSSLPAAGEMLAEMLKVVEAGDALCGVFISSDMSGTYESATLISNMVRERVPGAQIRLVDSRTNCMQEGYAVLAAARAAQQGADLDQVAAAAEMNIRCSRFVFIPKTLAYLERGGRIGHASALLANLLKIVPVLTVEDGFTTTLRKVRTRAAAEEAMLAQLENDVRAHGFGEAAIHHINCLDDAQALARTVEQRLGAPAAIVDIGPVIGLHVGPGSIGIAYYTREPLR
ncbi:MAG: DegV family protein [Anaerolineae bacterium]